jgi:hypothetical protein
VNGAVNLILMEVGMSIFGKLIFLVKKIILYVIVARNICRDLKNMQIIKAFWTDYVVPIARLSFFWLAGWIAFAVIMMIIIKM